MSSAYRSRNSLSRPVPTPSASLVINSYSKSLKYKEKIDIRLDGHLSYMKTLGSTDCPTYP